MLTRALSWSVLSAITGVIAQIGLMAVLSRLLTPAQFGLVASAAIAMRFVSYFAKAGLGPALIQRKELEPAHESAAFAAAFAMGIVCWLVFIALAAPFAVFFKADELRAILIVTPASMLFSALASVPQSMLRRALRFKALAGIDLFSQVIGYGATGIVLALMGFGVWALVIAAIVQQAASLALSAMVANSQLFTRFERRHVRDLFGYGARYSLNGFLEFVSANVESMFIGRVLNMSQLGFYNRAQTVTSLPIEQIMGAASRVMFPAFATMRQSEGKLREGLLLSIHLCMLLTLPIACGMSVAADHLVLGVLGPQWGPAAEVARVSAWCIPSLYIGLFAGSALDTLARFRGKTVLIVAITALKIGLMISAAQFGYGLVGVAAAMVLSEWLRALATVQLLRADLNVSLLDVLVRLTHGAAVAAAVGLAVALTGRAAEGFADALHPHLVPLIAQVIVGAIVFFSAAWLSLRHIVGQYDGGTLDVGPLRRMARVGARA